jgi:hypothetical protein
MAIQVQTRSDRVNRILIDWSSAEIFAMTRELQDPLQILVYRRSPAKRNAERRVPLP